ncbi:MAG TPA: hypothetical protein VK513_16780 [Terriglobales bacterium]|jgi:hypothetical protein|nr:hypothetical protein [Terriglobales bacterium]
MQNRSGLNGVVRCSGRLGTVLACVLAFVVGTSVSRGTAFAQSLNWEGQTGVFVTPLAYSVSTGSTSLSLPVVSYHYLNAGPVLGGFHQVSVTMGAFNRIEFGYTRSLHQDGTTAGLSELWSGGFNAFHGKVNLFRERRAGLPALSVGFVARTQVRNVGGVLQGQDTHNQDFYVVATKTITHFRKLPLVFNLGFKATNASLLGLAGNAPGYSGRAFGAGGFAFKGPGRSTILLGSEVLQEPRSIQGLPGAVIPTTITYAVRIVPAGALPIHGWGVETPKLTLDFGLAQAAGNIAPGVDLQARRQFAFGISYGF